MSVSPVFLHYAATAEVDTISPVYLHRVTAGAIDTISPVYLHRVAAGVPATVSPVFSHIALYDPTGKIRGPQLESPLQIERAIDFEETVETTSPEGKVRLFAQDGNLRFVNSSGTNVNLGLLGVPLGGVIPWYPPPDATEPPESFEYADGSLVSTANSPFLGVAKPALMRSEASPGQTQRFVRGADTSGGISAVRSPNAIISGGADSHSHEGTTDPDGNTGHTHGPGTLRFPIDGDLADIQGALYDPAVGGAVLILDAPSPDIETLHTHLQDTHDHGSLTSIDTHRSVGETDISGAHAHTTTSDTQSNLPSFVELPWIIRVI